MKLKSMLAASLLAGASLFATAAMAADPQAPAATEKQAKQKVKPHRHGRQDRHAVAGSRSSTQAQCRRGQDQALPSPRREVKRWKNRAQARFFVSRPNGSKHANP